jgi:hypothetical protein
VYLPYIFIVLLIGIAVGGLALGVWFISIPAAILLVVAVGWMFAARGAGMHLSRRTGGHAVPSSAEASASPVVDPAQPVGGTTAAEAGD